MGKVALADGGTCFSMKSWKIAAGDTTQVVAVVAGEGI